MVAQTKIQRHLKAKNFYRNRWTVNVGPVVETQTKLDLSVHPIRVLQRFPGGMVYESAGKPHLLAEHVFGDYPFLFVFRMPGDTKSAEKNLVPGTPDHVMQPVAKALEAAVAGVEDPSTFNITLSGGEPALHRSFWEVVARFSDAGFPITILTNGQAFADRRFLHNDLRYRIWNFQISIEGPDAETHDRRVGCPGGFNRTVQAIVNAQEGGVRFIILQRLSQGRFPRFPRHFRRRPDPGAGTRRATRVRRIGRTTSDRLGPWGKHAVSLRRPAAVIGLHPLPAGLSARHRLASPPDV